MNYLLSYGGGVNSTALILLMEDACEFVDIFDQLHILFADTGCEHPQTYTYLEQMDAYLAQRGQRIIRVSAEQPLLEMCHERNFLPSRMNRWCTREAKLNPLWIYEGQTFHIDYRRDELQLIRFIGIDAGEVHRVRASKQKQVKQRYPLIEYNLDRQGCQKLIERKGLPLPRKSGCFMCPFAARHELARLSIEYPHLFEQALQLEHTVNKVWKERKEPFHLSSVRSAVRFFADTGTSNGKL